MPAPNKNTRQTDSGGGGKDQWWSPVKTTPMPKPRVTAPAPPPLQDYFDQLGNWWNGVFNQPKPTFEYYYDPNEKGQMGVKKILPTTTVPKTPFPGLLDFENVSDWFKQPTISETLQREYPPDPKPKKQWYTDINGQLRMGVPPTYNYNYYTPVPPWSGVPDNWQTRQARNVSENPEWAPRYVGEPRDKNTPQDYFDRIAINGRGYSVPNQMLNFTDTGGVWPWEPMPSWYEPPAGLTNAQGWKEWNVGEGGATGGEPAGGAGGTGGNGYGYGNWGGGYGASNYDSKPAYPTQGYKQDPNIYYQQLVKWVI